MTDRKLTGQIAPGAANTAVRGTDTANNENGFFIYFPNTAGGNTSAYGWYGNNADAASSDVATSDLAIIEGGQLRYIGPTFAKNLNEVWFAAPSSDDFFCWQVA